MLGKRDCRVVMGDLMSIDGIDTGIDTRFVAKTMHLLLFAMSAKNVAITKKKKKKEGYPPLYPSLEYSVGYCQGLIPRNGERACNSAEMAKCWWLLKIEPSFL